MLAFAWLVLASPLRAEVMTATMPSFAAIPSGSFQMGARKDDPAASPDEWPRHKIHLASGFELSTKLVTRGAFAAFVTDTNHVPLAGCWALTEAGWRLDPQASWQAPGFEQTDTHPVVCVSRVDALAFLSWASARDGTHYRLPSEAEWDYASRQEGAPPWQSPEQICQFGNVNDLTAKNKVAKVAEPCNDGFFFTSPVATFAPGPHGLYDMVGNVWEWMEDCADDDYADTPRDGSPARQPGCDLRVLRGHSWTDAPGPIRVETRLFLDEEERQSIVGFRMVREPRLPIPPRP
ncbi:MAG: SUMF1/EgtB/PvdO family nonheme iron enzyme [Parvibaculum sp.]